MIDKKGEKNLSLYAYFFLYACFMFLLSSFGIKALFIKQHVYFWYQELVKEIISFVLQLVSRSLF